MTRQITNAAAGSEDTDAVNVAQLKSLNPKMDDLDAFNVKYDTKDDGSVNKPITLGDTVISWRGKRNERQRRGELRPAERVGYEGNY